MIPVVYVLYCLVFAFIAPFVYDDQKKASEGNDGKSKDAVQAEIDAAKAAMLTKPSKFVVFLVMFYAFLEWQLCMVLSSIQKLSDYLYVDLVRDAGSRYDIYLYDRFYLCSTFLGIHDG